MTHPQKTAAAAVALLLSFALAFPGECVAGFFQAPRSSVFRPNGMTVLPRGVKPEVAKALFEFDRAAFENYNVFLQKKERELRAAGLFSSEIEEKLLEHVQPRNFSSDLPREADDLVHAIRAFRKNADARRFIEQRVLDRVDAELEQLPAKSRPEAFRTLREMRTAVADLNRFLAGSVKLKEALNALNDYRSRQIAQKVENDIKRASQRTKRFGNHFGGRFDPTEPLNLYFYLLPETSIKKEESPRPRSLRRSSPKPNEPGLDPVSSEFETRKALMDAIAEHPPGAPERKSILYRNGNRAAVLNSGANLTLYSGKAKGKASSAYDRLRPISVALIERRNREGKPDGLGALGGLSNRTPMTSEEFDALGAQEQVKILNEPGNEKDDIVLKDGRWTLTDDIDVIRINTLQRGLREALTDLGIKESEIPVFDNSAMGSDGNTRFPISNRIILGGVISFLIALFTVLTPTPLPLKIAAAAYLAAVAAYFLLVRMSGGNSYPLKTVEIADLKDDNYLLKIWDGTSPPAEKVFAVTPYMHLLQMDKRSFKKLLSPRRAKAGGEAAGFKETPLLQALKSFGSKAPDDGPALEDGRDASNDYRYPHEWMAAWALASSELGHDPEALVDLAKKLQLEIGQDYLIDFNVAAKLMGVSLENLDAALKVPPGTVEKMQRGIAFIAWNLAFGQFPLKTSTPL